MVELINTSHHMCIRSDDLAHGSHDFGHVNAVQHVQIVSARADELGPSPINGVSQSDTSRSRLPP